MQKILFAIPLLIMVSVLTKAQTAKPVNLFNGRDLTGWKVHGTEKWFVQNGELICESGPDKQYGYLVTDGQYKNFELTVEFKQESNGNSGVFFHSSVDGTTVAGWQAEIAPAGKHTGGIYESYGRGWLIQPTAEKEKYLQEGQWNKLVVRVKDNEVKTWLNGHEMIVLQDEKIGASTGSISLQIHDGGGVKVRWRSIVIQPL